MHFQLFPKHTDEDTQSVSVEVGDLRCQSVYSHPSSPISPDPHFSPCDLPGVLQGKPVKVNLWLHLQGYYLQMQVDEGTWVSVAETPDMLRLRANLLRQLIHCWRSMQDTDPLGWEAREIVQQAWAEIKRIEAH